MVDLMKLTMKSRLLLLFKEEGEMWVQDAVERLLAVEGMQKSERWSWVIRFYMMEMSVNGMLEILDEALDDGTYFGKDVILTKYKITDFGIERVNAVLGE